MITATIYFPNDPSVGIFAESFEAQLPFNGFEDSEHREWVRDSFKRLYDEMNGEFYCRVYFSDEKE
jgi:hypothetical protein